MCANVLVKNVGLCESEEEHGDLLLIDGAFQGQPNTGISSIPGEPPLFKIWHSEHLKKNKTFIMAGFPIEFTS